MGQTNITSKDKSVVGNRTRAIVACSDPEIRQRLLSVLGEFGLQPVLPETLEDAKSLVTREETAMAFVQPNFSKGSLQEVLKTAEGAGSMVPVIVCSEFYDKDLYIDAMAQGAFDYLAFPYRREELAWVINNAVGWGSAPHTAHA